MNTVLAEMSRDRSIKSVCAGLALCAVLAGAMLAPLRTSAQSALDRSPDSNLRVPQRIVALVNDEPISAYDVLQRLRLTIAQVGGIENQDELARLEEQVIRNMVDDKLKIQEARSFEVEITDVDANDAFARQADGMGMTPQQFESQLAQMGVSKSVFLEQIKAEIAWSSLVNGRFGNSAQPSSEEVTQEIDQLKSNAGKPEYLLSEIFLLVSDAAQENAVRGNAQRIVEQLRQGSGNFPAFAQQFSQSSTAAAGGSMGWVTADQLNPVLADALSGLQLDQVTDPIRAGGGYYILQVNDRRRVLEADPLDAEMDLRSILFTMDEKTGEERIEAFVDGVEALKARDDTTCSDLDRYANELGTNPPAELGRLSLRDLGRQMRPILQNLRIGEPSRPVTMPDGLRVFFVCGRDKPEVELPTYDEIAARLENQHLAMIARRYLRDLRRNAIIDYRSVQQSAQLQ